MKTKTIFNPAYKRFIAEIVKLRKEKGISQAKLAVLTGWSGNTIARIELRERRLDYFETVLILKAIGLSKSEISKFLEKFI